MPSSDDATGPLVSVVIPLYNDHRTITLCLESVYAQWYRPIEVVVVDDASTDDSAARAAAFPCRLITAATNGGPGASRNLGVRHSRGDIIFFLDADMTVQPDAVGNAVALLTSGLAADGTGYGAVFGIPDMVPLLPETVVGHCRILQYHYWRSSSEGPTSAGGYAMGAIRRSVFEEAGWFREALRQTEVIDHGERVARRHPMLLTSAISGRMSDESRVWPLLRKAYLRSHLRVPFYIDRGKAMRGLETGNRAVAAGLAGLTLASMPAVVWTPPAGVVTALLLAGFIATDPGQYRFVVRERGWRYLLPFTLLHLAVNSTVAAGLGTGLIRWALSRRFRALYRGGATGREGPHRATRPASSSASTTATWTPR